VQASDDVGVSKVELYANGALVGVDYAGPYTFSLATLPSGKVTLLVKAYDAAGNVGQATVAVRRLAVSVARRPRGRPAAHRR